MSSPSANRRAAGAPFAGARPPASSLRGSSPPALAYPSSDHTAVPGAHAGADFSNALSGDGADDADPNALAKLIWGTNIVLAESQAVFQDFLRSFKPKYRAAYDAALARAAAERGGDDAAPPPPNALYDRLTPAKAEETLYVTYLRTMRLTQQTNLNLDALNLLAFPPARKLYHQLVAYPQEIIPIMDNVLKDLMIELAEEDYANAQDQLERDLLEEEEREISGRVYKVRPFGGEKVVNMRELNPQGAWGEAGSRENVVLTRVTPPADTDKLVTVKGLVIRATPVIPDMKQGGSIHLALVPRTDPPR